MSNLKNVIESSMVTYAGAVIQNRALVDVRDGLKPSARQIFYSMMQHKLTADKPYKKTMNAIGMAMADYYIHGDSSCEGIIMRAGQPFAMRYPLVDVKGNAGSLIESGNWAAPRYTESKLSKLSSYLFKDIDKNATNEWRDSYDNTKQYPAVLPSKGYYNIVNGSMGIAVGMACSIPQFNLKELNNALIYLVNHADCDFEDIYCAPDYATGGILYNEAEVKESMKKGTGAACKLRSVVEFNAKERCFVVTEVPYGVYTNTICRELEDIVNGEDNPGIDRFNDLTGKTPLIKIYLSKHANPDKVLKYLYKETSLQSYYGINFTMLDQGKYPRVFTWKEMLMAHIDHEADVYRRCFNYDLNKCASRLHIIDGLLICLASIEEVIQVIKGSTSAAEASKTLMAKFVLDEAQTKAVLDMKLSRLAHLEVQKLEDEKTSLQKEIDRISAILNDNDLFNNEMIKGWKEISEKFGDARRTKIIELQEENDEPIEEKRLLLSFSNHGAVYVNETSTLYTQNRNGVGSKFKLEKDEYIVDNLTGKNTDTILFFTNIGNFYHMKMSEFTINEKQYLSNFVTLTPSEQVIAAAVLSRTNQKPNIIFITKKGILKKSEITEYNLKRKGGALAIKLDKGDEIASILFTDKEKIGIATQMGQLVIIETEPINAIGRVTRGVVGIKLNPNDVVISARRINEDARELISISKDGLIKRTSISEFSTTGRATKGKKLQKTDSLQDFLPISTESSFFVVSTTAYIKLNVSDVPLLSTGAQGVHSMKLNNSKILTLNYS